MIILVILAAILAFLALCLVGYGLVEGSLPTGVAGLVLFVVFGGVMWWGQTHVSVPVNTVVVTRNRITQELSEPLHPGLRQKPFFASIHKFPSAGSYPLPANFTPAIEGGIGVTLNTVMYIDTSAVDWAKEIDRVGTLDSAAIMKVWRDSVVRDVAEVVKSKNPSSFNSESLAIQGEIYLAINPWFEGRGIKLHNISLTNWDFTNPEVARAYDQSIEAQAEIARENSLQQAAVVQRERLLYEATTANLVSAEEAKAVDQLGLVTEGAKIQYLWIRAMRENGDLPDNVVLDLSSVSQDGVTVSVPLVPAPAAEPSPTLAPSQGPRTNDGG